MSFAKFEKENRARAKADKEHDDYVKGQIRKNKQIEKDLERRLDLSKQLVDSLRDEQQTLSSSMDFVNKMVGTQKLEVALLDNAVKLSKARTEEDRKKLQFDQKALLAQGDLQASIKSQLEPMMKIADQAEKFTMALLTNPMVALAAAALALAKFLFDIAKGALETRKELGTSLMISAKLEVQTRALALAGKVYGLEVENIKAAQTAIRNELGLSVQEAANLSLQFAKTAAVTGQSEEQLAKTLSIMESISDASREALLSQIETTGQMLEMQGLAPGEIFQDIADNAEHFATFAKDGGMNVIKAAAAAKKLGLNMSAVASTTEALLDFESSIEKQMEASMLLGREINLDKARQLAFMDDQEGMMKEILKQVGGEAEFSKLVGTQRKVLAESVGLNVEQLSRLVRNNTATTTGKAVTAGAKTGDSTEELLTDHTQLFQSMNKHLKTIAE